MEEDNKNGYIYGGGEDGADEVYVVEDKNFEERRFEVGESTDGFQGYAHENGIIQLQDVEGLEGGQYIYYDESGQAYIVNPSENEAGQTYIIDPNNNEQNDLDIYDNTNDNRLITYNCPLCAQVYQNANAFTKHTREKHFVKVFTCRQCEQFFDNLSLLFLHARRTHVDPRKPTKNPASYKFHCPDCDYMTNNGGTMEHHRRAHSGIKPYKCDICDKAFAQKANMKTHKNRHIHKDRIFRCETCSKSFNSHDIYLAHLRTREHELQEHFQMMLKTKVQIQCMGCNEEFKSYYDVNKHSRSCDILKDLINKFWCIQCKVGFPTSTSLKSHLKAHGGNEIISCPVCGERGFPGFNQLNHHITRAHALKVNRRNVCRYCEMTFETKIMLDNHIEEMHVCEKNGRQSRGAAGRLRCRYSICDFTSNSVMLMDRHHDQHVSNTLPLATAKRVVRRPRKNITPLVLKEEEEEMIETEIEHTHSDFTADNEVFRRLYCEEEDNRVKLELLEADNDDIEQRIHEDNIDDMDVDDLEKLATFYVEDDHVKTNSSDVKRKRGRPRKCSQVLPNYQNSVKNEELDIPVENDQDYDESNHSLIDQDYYRQFEFTIDEVNI